MKEVDAKTETLSKSDNEVIESIKDWLIANRGYKEYDFSEDFVSEKLLPLLKLVKHGEIIFGDNKITQKLRIPLEAKNSKGDTEKRITELNYKVRYQDWELQNYTKGINVSKDPMAYVTAQIAMLTDQPKGIIGKLYDVDSNNTKLISALYFLG